MATPCRWRPCTLASVVADARCHLEAPSGCQHAHSESDLHQQSLAIRAARIRCARHRLRLAPLSNNRPIPACNVGARGFAAALPRGVPSMIACSWILNMRLGIVKLTRRWRNDPLMTRFPSSLPIGRIRGVRRLTEDLFCDSGCSPTAPIMRDGWRSQRERRCQCL